MPLFTRVPKWRWKPVIGSAASGVGDDGARDAEVDERGDDHVAGEAARGIEEEDLAGAAAPAGEVGRAA